ncbi:MAG: DUF2934 domain-containing protein [Nitrospirales bacterium]|nr:DUF2934 domain-containing protein [Nitrospirales bacterium]
MRKDEMRKDEEIKKIAYELFEKSGREHGKEMDHWLEAERMVKARQMDRHAADAEAVAAKGHPHERSDARWHEARKSAKK